MTEDLLNNGRNGDRELESIFARATPRPAPPEHVTRRVRNAVHLEWRSVMAERAGRANRRFMAIAASLVAAIAVALFIAPRVGPDSPVFDAVEVARVTGRANLTSSSGEMASLAAGQLLALARGDALETGALGGTTLELGGGRELRVAAATRVIMADSGHIRLEQGKLYFDSGHVAGSEIVIDTSKGQVRHLGTRFLVALTPAELRVAVRDGRVEVDGEKGGTGIAGPGQVLVVSENGDKVLGHEGAFGPQWQWVEALVPPLSIEGMSLYSVISWAARESGRSVEFANPALEEAARETLLHGNLVLTDPMLGLSQTMLTTRMDYRLNKEIIVIVSRT